MMEKTKKYLSDILLAITLIEEFTKDLKTFSDYEKDLKTQSAVERKLAIIGEALIIIKKVDPKLNIEKADKIIGFRNRIVHAYDSIDNAIVWTILKRHLPELKKEVEPIFHTK